MSFLRIALAAAVVLAFNMQSAQATKSAATVVPLLQKDLPEYPGKEMLAITVTYPPGAVDPEHRHDAHTFVYVLEGSLVMQVKGGKEMTLKPGETFYENPGDIHTVSRNASATEPAKFLVVFLKKKGAEVVLPAK